MCVCPLINACSYVCRSYTGDPGCVCTCMGRLDVNFGYFLCSPSTLYTEAQSLTTSQLTPRVPFLPPEGTDYRQSPHSLGIYLGAWVSNSSPHANPYPEPQTLCVEKKLLHNYTRLSSPQKSPFEYNLAGHMTY